MHHGVPSLRAETPPDWLGIQGGCDVTACLVPSLVQTEPVWLQVWRRELPFCCGQGSCSAPRFPVVRRGSQLHACTEAEWQARLPRVVLMCKLKKRKNIKKKKHSHQYRVLRKGCLKYFILVLLVHIICLPALTVVQRFSITVEGRVSI